MKKIFIVVIAFSLISMHQNTFAGDIGQQQKESDKEWVDAAKKVLIPAIIIGLVWGVIASNSPSLSEKINEKGDLSLSDNLSFGFNYFEFDNTNSFDRMDSFSKNLTPCPTVMIHYSW